MRFSLLTDNPARRLDGARRMRAAVRLMEEREADLGHARAVARLSARVFDDLLPVHGLDREARDILVCAAMLHDIAKESDPAHHQAAFRLILASMRLDPSVPVRLLIGLTARYHRRDEPSTDHRHFAALPKQERELVRWLAAMLRLADALDSTHCGTVERVRCTVQADHIVARCALAGGADTDKRRAIKHKAIEKGFLLRKMSGRRLSVKWGADRAT